MDNTECEMVKKYDDASVNMDPNTSIPGSSFENIRPENCNNAKFANWTKLKCEEAIKKGKPEHAKKFLSLHNEAVKESKLDDINNEITNYYFRSYDIQRAEFYIRNVVNLINDQENKDNDDISENNSSIILTFLNEFESYVEKPIIDAFRSVTATLKGFKEKVKDLKEQVKGFLSRTKTQVSEGIKTLKDKFYNAFNSALNYFLRIIGDLISAMFSFIDLINDVAKGKEYKFKGIQISFDPPSIENTLLLGFPLPIPKISIPKLVLNYEAKENMENEEWSQEVKESNSKTIITDPNANAITWNDPLNMNPDAKSWFDKGKEMGDSNKHKEAVKNYDKALEISPNNIDLLNYKGVALYRLKEYSKSQECFETAININPKNDSIWKNQGNLYYAIGNFVKAKEAYGEAIKINTNNMKAREGYSKSLHKLGKHNEADMANPYLLD